MRSTGICNWNHQTNPLSLIHFHSIHNRSAATGVFSFLRLTNQNSYSVENGVTGGCRCRIPQRDRQGSPRSPRTYRQQKLRSYHASLSVTSSPSINQFLFILRFHCFHDFYFLLCSLITRSTLRSCGAILLLLYYFISIFDYFLNPMQVARCGHL